MKNDKIAFIERYSISLLITVSLLQYMPTLFFGITGLDDRTFIVQYQVYNSHLSNIFTSFSRGVFNVMNLPYYRPVFLDSMLLNSLVCGQNILGYHLVNILLHSVALILLFTLLKKLNIRPFHAFLLSLIFAVHPVLTQAVAWIPGRNDSLLAIFVFAFLISSINYFNNGKIRYIFFIGVFLLLSLFTKETAVVAIPAVTIILLISGGNKWYHHRSLYQIAVWLCCFFAWLYILQRFVPVSASFSLKRTIYNFLHRMPVIIQYLGKIFFPVNLSVYPTQKDTGFFYGYIGSIILLILIFLSRKRSREIMAYGLILFFLFLLPSLIIPNAANNPQVYEHRLYLPFLGILLFLSQTIIFNNALSDKKLLNSSAIIIIVLSATNFCHQQSFSSPLAFWTQAVKTSPNSPNTNMMLAINTTDRVSANRLFKKAFQINPKQKYLNLRYGVFLLKADSVQTSEMFFRDEIEISGTYECYYYLARIAIKKNDLLEAIVYMREFLEKDPFFDRSTENKAFLDPVLFNKNSISKYLNAFTGNNNMILSRMVYILVYNK